MVTSLEKSKAGQGGGGGGAQVQNQKHHGEAGSGVRCEASLQGALRGLGSSQVQSTGRVWEEQPRPQ